MEDPGNPSEHVGFSVPIVSESAFSATWLLSDSSVVVRFAGNADSEVAPVLGGFLERLHAEAVRARIQEVVLDFRELTFLTSSCIKYLVVAINRLSATEIAFQYRLRFVTATAHRWQVRSFEVLRQMAPELVLIDRS